MQTHAEKARRELIDKLRGYKVGPLNGATEGLQEQPKDFYLTGYLLPAEPEDGNERAQTVTVDSEQVETTVAVDSRDR